MWTARSCPVALPAALSICISFGCSRPGAAPGAAAATKTASTPAPIARSRIVGQVRAADAGAPVVVTLDSRGARLAPRPAERPVMDQVGAAFAPAFLLVRTGEPAEFRNNDDTLHNVHVTHEESRQAAFNVAIPIGASYTYTFARDGFYRVGCDIHPAMAAEILATSAPWAIVAERDGRFTFSDVEPGSYSMTVYANGTRVQRDVDVKAGVTEVAF